MGENQKKVQVYDQTKRNNEIQSFFGEVYCQILRYLNIQLEDRLTEIVLNHVLGNDVIRDNSQSKVASFRQNVVKIIGKCRMYGLKKVIFFGFSFHYRFL